MAIPQLNARRSPRIANWRGMYPSTARIRARRGAPLKPVFAARMRMSVVTAWKSTNGQPVPEDLLRDLGDEGDLLGRVRDDAEREGEDGHAHEDRPEQEPHRGHRVRGIPRLGRLEGGHAVRDRLRPAERHRAEGEGPDDEDHGQGLEPAFGRHHARGSGTSRPGRRPRSGRSRCRSGPGRPPRRRRSGSRRGCRTRAGRAGWPPRGGSWRGWTALPGRAAAPGRPR